MEEDIQSLRQDMKILKRTQIPAIRIKDKELFHHLDLIPYIRIPGHFDHKACFKEAYALLSRFRTHSDDVLSGAGKTKGRWKSLALRAVGGDSKNTLNNPHYGSDDRSFQMTEIASACPVTVSFLKTITELEQCERIRFMLLEPGARLHPHSDAYHLNVLPSINIALNMPKECRFFVDCKPDGSPHQYTVELPFKAGDIMIVNTAKYHYVVNDSNEHRIHMIINGPVRFTSAELLDRARKQNHLTTKSEVIRALVQKYRVLDFNALPQSVLYQLGLTAVKLPPQRI